MKTLHTQRRPGAEHMQANRLFIFSVVVAAVKERGHIVPSSITGLSAHGCSLTFVCCTLNVSTHNGASKKPSPVVHRQHGRLSDKNVRWERDGAKWQREREDAEQNQRQQTQLEGDTETLQVSWEDAVGDYNYQVKMMRNFCSSSLNYSHFVNSFPKFYFP